MADDLEWYAEADRRGLLSGPDKAWFDEAKRRGLVPGSASKQAPDTSDEDVNVIGDVAKSAGIGLAQGGIGLATLPGNLEKLGRMGINGVAGLLGSEDNVVNPDTALTNYDDLKGHIEGYTGEFYKPKTTAGEYARTFGEMLPNAIGGPATIGGKVAAVAGPALLSETGGQLAKGGDYEGLARVGGAIAGGLAGPRMVSRAVTPVRPTAEAMQAADALEAAGVTGLTAGQRTGNRALRVAEQVTDYVPFSGRRNAQMADEANRTFTQASMRSVGLREAPDVLPDQPNMQRMAQEMGREYDNLRIATDIRYDPRFLSRLQRQSRDYYDNAEAGAQVQTIRRLVDDITQRSRTAQVAGGPVLTGAQYQTARSRLSSAAQSAKDPTTKRTLRDIVNTLDAQAIRSLPRADQPAARAYMRDLNQRYRGFKTMEDAVTGVGSNKAQGLINSSNLYQAVKKGNKTDVTRGSTAAARLANAGEQVMERLPDSGTAQRSALLKIMSGENASKVGAGLALGGSGMGMVDAATGGATLATGAGLSRLLMSRPIQAYLSNRVYPNGMPAAPIGPTRRAAADLTRGYVPPIPEEIRLLTLPATAAKNYAPLSGSQQGLTAEQLEEEERKGAFR